MTMDPTPKPEPPPAPAPIFVPGRKPTSKGDRDALNELVRAQTRLRSAYAELERRGLIVRANAPEPVEGSN